MARSRRLSSGLGGDPRGDTGAPAMATYNQVSTSPSSSSSLTDNKEPTSTSTNLRTRRSHPRARSRRRSLLRRWIAVSLRHTWLNPLILILLVFSIYLRDPSSTNLVHPLIFLSYPLSSSDLSRPTCYGKGRRDVLFVVFYIIVLSFTREFLMQRVMRPLAIRLGIRSRGKQARFMEQMYTASYFAVFGPLGLYVMSRTPVWYFNTTAFFTDYPHRTHEAVFKAYYLLQASYWAQQALVLLLQLEKPRKDFRELVGHHVITIFLIGMSYRFHFTHIGLAVYITHDISDFFLASSKSLNYIDSPLVGPYFAIFAGVWIYLRHYINCRILWSTFTTFRTVGPFEFSWAEDSYKCRLAQLIAITMLGSLQAVNLFWLWLILRIARNYVFKRDWVDERSDGETEEEVEVGPATDRSGPEMEVEGGRQKTDGLNGIAGESGYRTVDHERSGLETADGLRAVNGIGGSRPMDAMVAEVEEKQKMR